MKKACCNGLSLKEALNMTLVIESKKTVLPSNARLLAGLRTALSGVGHSGVNDEIANVLQTADIVLNELLLRCDPGFYLGFYSRAKELARSALPLLEEKGGSEAAQAASLISALPENPTATMSFEAVSQCIEAAMRAIETAVHALRPIKGSTSSWLFSKKASEAESELYMHSLGPASGSEVQKAKKKSSFTRDRLQSYLDHRFPERGWRIVEFRHLVGGYQKITILFDVEDLKGNKESLVLRGEKNDRFLQFDCSNVSEEFDVVAMAYQSGIPVPEPMFVERDDAALGNAFMVTRRAAGQSLGSAVKQDAMPLGVMKSFLAVMAKIHATPLDERIQETSLSHWLTLPDLKANTKLTVESWRNQPWVKKASASPALARLTDWLVDNVPGDDAAPCFMHIDYGPHNVLVENEQVTAVLDWESARIGDPAEDITYFVQSVGGKIDCETALAYYYDAGGSPIGEYRIRYFQAFNAIKLLTASMSSSAIFEYDPNSAFAWCDMGILYRGLGTDVESKIQAAERAKSL
jgi:aminoglycoside phosphotransferase (APT) family kinase protein